MASDYQPPDNSVAHNQRQPADDFSTTDFPSGVIQTVQLPHSKFEEYLDGNDADLTVMMKIFHAERLVDQFENPRSPLEPAHSVVTSSAIDDSKLKRWNWSREVECIQSFEPDYHLMADRSLYRTMELSRQREALKRWAKGTQYVTHKLADTDTRLIPFAKGWKGWHFQYCANILDQLGFEVCAFYASGYQYGHKKLETHIRHLISEMGPKKILLIGPQYREALECLPPEVVAAAGTRWRRKNTYGGRIFQPLVEEWISEREELLGTGQYQLSSFEDTQIAR